MQGVFRRGLQLEALKEFILSQGASKNVTLQEWEKLWSINKRIIDPVCPRWIPHLCLPTPHTNLIPHCCARGNYRGVVLHLNMRATCFSSSTSAPHLRHAPACFPWRAEVQCCSLLVQPAVPFPKTVLSRCGSCLLLWRALAVLHLTDQPECADSASLLSK